MNECVLFKYTSSVWLTTVQVSLAYVCVTIRHPLIGEPPSWSQVEFCHQYSEFRSTKVNKSESIDWWLMQ